MNLNRWTRGLVISAWTLLTFAAAIPVASQAASASVISELPDDFADALDISPGLAGMIMSVGILCSAGALLAIAKVKPIGMILVLVSLMLLLTAMQWLDEVFIVFSGVILAIYFALSFKGIFG